jgi:putative ABC transport system permease protein
VSWARFFRRRRWDDERARELEAYLADETAVNLARGMSADAARNAAARKLGNATLIREEIYRMNSIGFLETVAQDLRYALRVLGKSPGFAAVAILSLALGIGANTAVFSVIHAVLLRPLPYPEPGRLAIVGQQGSHGAVSLPELTFWKEHTRAFQSAAGYRGSGDRSLVSGAHQEWITTMIVTADFFRTLGVPLQLGREFDASELRVGGPAAVLLTDALWRRACGADPAIVGQTVRLDDASFTVAGVLPRDFWFPQAADAILPLLPTRTMDNSGINTRMIARLKPGVTLGQAQAEMPAITEGMRRQYRMGREYRGLAPLPYQEWLVGDVRLNLLLVFGAVGLLLLIACSNLASLLLARLATRQKETAVRLALGGSRGRLLRQFLAENLMLTLAGGAAGLLGARMLLRVMIAAVPFRLPTSEPIRLDTPVLLFTLAVALLTGALFSLAPLLSAARVDLQELLKAGGRSTAGGARQRTRSVLVIAEVALSVTMLVSAGLLIQTLYQLHREHLGFNPSGLATFSTPFAAERRRDAAANQQYQNIVMERLRALPGVHSVAGVNRLPLGEWGNMPTQREGHTEQSIGGMEVRRITPAYFEVMRIPIRKGRAFVATDTESATPVILVNETLARQWWPGADPLGDRVVIGRFQGRDFGTPTPRQVVGVVADVKTGFLKEPARPTVYVPSAQDPGSGSVTWVLRADLSPGLAGEIRHAISELDSRQRVLNIRSMEDVVASATASSRFDAWLFGFLAGLAVLLTAIGLYGLLAFSVARRTGEIGTRMALGASRAAVLKLVLKEGAGLIALGLAIGLAGALAVTRTLATLLYGVRPTDPVTFAMVAVLLLAVGLLASYIPARRATKVDPMVALRYE